MKRVMAALAVIGACTWACGFKGFPPGGCRNPQATCVCDSNGCRWIWVCDN